MSFQIKDQPSLEIYTKLTDLIVKNDHLILNSDGTLEPITLFRRILEVVKSWLFCCAGYIDRTDKKKICEAVIYVINAGDGIGVRIGNDQYKQIQARLNLENRRRLDYTKSNPTARQVSVLPSVVVES